MAEIMEYSLVFLVSILFVSGSVATYDSFSAYVTGLQFRLASTSIIRLANAALANGSATAAIAVPLSKLACDRGTLTFSSGSQTERTRIGEACDFSLSISGGTHSFGFHLGQGLTVTVS